MQVLVCKQLLQAYISTVNGLSPVQGVKVNNLLNVVNLEEDRRLPDEEIMEMAIIYRKETARPLSKYQKKMNDAAQQLCLQNPCLLKKRQLLIDTARAQMITDGFQFVKGKSRSRRDQQCDEEPTPKRPKFSQSFRENRMLQIEEDLQDLNDRIGFKDKRITAALNSKEYKKCDEIKEEVTALKHKRRELEAERKHLQKSSRQSEYRKRIQNKAPLPVKWRAVKKVGRRLTPQLLG